MRDPFSRRRDGLIEARLSEAEALAIRRVALDLIQAYEQAAEPALRRLFPPAYPEEPDRQAEFERMTREDLLAGKAAAARAVVTSIDRGKARRGRWSGTLDADAVRAWLGVVNDARLVLGTRLDVTEEMDHEPLPPEHPQAAALNLYLYLGGMEELLVEQLLGEIGTGPPETEA